MNICTQRRLARTPGLQVFCALHCRNVRRDATNRIRLLHTVPQQKFNHDIMSLARRHRYSFLKLDRRTRFDHAPIVRPHRFGNVMRVNIKVGFPADLVPLNKKSSFIFAVDQNVAKVEILNEYDGRRVI